MKKNLQILKLILFVLLIEINNSFGQHTFSIVAVDTVTGEVGSAGASFIGDVPHSFIPLIFDVHPGKGVVHTQAHWVLENHTFAKQLMNEGKSPQHIIDSVVANDYEGTPSVRQYIAIDLANGGRTAGYTGANCDDYKNHVLGKNYAIAGNILYGQDVLDSMESGFLNTSGNLADKLMAALQGGKKVGGDRRGYNYGLSSLMASLRIAKSNDSTDSLFLDLFFAYYNFNPGFVVTEGDPVDSLQVLYDIWKENTKVSDGFSKKSQSYCLYQNYPNPFNPTTTIEYDIPKAAHVRLVIYDRLGRHIQTLTDSQHQAGHFQIRWNGTDKRNTAMATGVYLCHMKADDFVKVIKLTILR